MLNIKPINISREQLVIIRSGGSSASKYPMARNIPIQQGHLMYAALKSEGEVLKGQDDIPRRNSSNQPWIVDCNALYFRGKVFAFFNSTAPISNQQMRMF